MQLNLSLKDCSKITSTSSGVTLCVGAPLRTGFAFTILLVFLLLSSCTPKQKTSSRMQVVASVPLLYDWTRNLMGESENSKLFLNLLLKNGLQYHSFTPGITEANLINSADLLIYVGGPSEKWIDDFLSKASTENPARIVVKLSDFAGNNNSDIDEHFITSPAMAKISCDKISQALCKLDPQNEASYKQYSSKYTELLSMLDKAYKIQTEKTEGQTFIICDRMPFAWLFKEYGFNYISLYDNCPAPDKLQPDLKTIKNFGQKIDQSGANAIYVFDNSDKKLARQVIANSKNPKCDTLLLDSMESLTLSQLFSGKNYINIMQNNLTLLRPN